MSLENNSHSVDKFLCDFSSLKENKISPKEFLETKSLTLEGSISKTNIFDL